MRDKALKEKRDKRMVKKFHELYNAKRMRIDDVLEELSKEHFFLTTEYIYNRIFYNKENNEYYESLLSEKTSK